MLEAKNAQQTVSLVQILEICVSPYLKIQKFEMEVTEKDRRLSALQNDLDQMSTEMSTVKRVSFIVMK